MTPPDSSDRARLGAVLLGGSVLGLALHAWAVRATTFHHGPLALTVLGALYVSFGALIVGSQTWSFRIGMPAPLLVGAGWAVVVGWHVREHAGRPLGGPGMFESPGRVAGFGALLLACVLLLYTGGRLVARRWGPPSFGAVLAIGVAFAALLAGSYFGSNLVRWHLLEQHHLLGPLAAHAFDAFLDAELDERWAARRIEASPSDLPGPPAAPALTGGSPDVVFILVDTLRADATRGASADAIRGFAEEGWDFRDVHANSSWTLPSMGSILTGLAPEEHGAVLGEDRLPEQRVTLPEIFRDRGYQTLAVVATGVVMGPVTGLDQGFDTFLDLGRLHRYGRARTVVTEAIDWLEEQTEDAPPFFLYVHFLDPHLPYRSGGEENPDTLEMSRIGYGNEVAYLDRVLGEVDFLRGAGPERPRIVVFTADHGEELGDHGGRGHAYSLYRELVHIPLIVHLPGGSRGTVDAPLEGRDIFDLTLHAVDGGDIAGWSNEHRRDTRRASLYTVDRSPLYRALRPYHADGFLWRVDQGLRVAIRSGRGDLLEYYDRGSDPLELRNLAGEQESEAQRLGALFGAGIRYWAEREDAELGPRDIERLRALGYIE